MKQELLDIEVTSYNELLEEVIVEQGKATRDYLQGFIEKGAFRDIISILVKREDGEYYWNRYTRTWKVYRTPTVVS